MTATLHIKISSVIVVKNDEDYSKASTLQFFPEVSQTQHKVVMLEA